MSHLYPLVIKPRLVERMWGGDALTTRFGKKDAALHKDPFGESWEVYEENHVTNGAYKGRTIGELRGIMGQDLMGQVDAQEIFPLLTKIIDAGQSLSVQVHPDDHFAREQEGQPYGKTECWFVIDAVPEAVLTYGFTEDSGPDEYERRVGDGTLGEILRPLPVSAGDVVYIPAGTVHAIGAGIIVYELQQTSDVTYRIYDWNRTDANGRSRELHVDKAKRVLDYHRWTRDKVVPLHDEATGRTTIIAGPHFWMELVDLRSSILLDTHESPVVVSMLEDPGFLVVNDNEESLPSYSSALVPAAVGQYMLQPKEGRRTRALVAYVPPPDNTLYADLLRRGFSQESVDAFLAQFAPAQDLGQPVAPAERRI